jgi:hypothetical protein
MTNSPNLLNELGGFSANQHRELMNTFTQTSGTDGLTAHAGGGQGSALALTTIINRISTVATAGDSVALPASTAGSICIIANDAANACQVFGAGTDTINDVATATGVSQLGKSTVLYACSTAGKWYSIGLAALGSSSFTDSITAHAGGGQGSATALTTKFNRVTTVATAGDSVALPASAGGLEITVINAASNSMQVFGAGTDTINGVATATGVNQVGKSTIVYRCTTAGAWTTSLVLQSGDSSGVAGGLTIYPGTASKGSLQLLAVNNTGNTATIISNAAMGQASTISIPDPGASTDTFALLGTANVFTATNQVNTLNIGASGTVGSLNLFSTTASKGKWNFAPVDNTGNTTMTLTNAAQGGAYTYTIPNAGASASFLMSQGTQTIVGANTFSAALTPTGGIAAAGGFSASPRGIHTNQHGAFATTDGTNVTASSTTTYIAEIFVPANMTITGIALFNGTSVAGNVTVGLATSAGAPIGAALSASTSQSGTTAYQLIPFATPYPAVGPATYYIQVQFSSGSANFRAHVLGTIGATTQTGQTYGVMTSFTPPTTFTTNVGPIAGLY